MRASTRSVMACHASGIPRPLRPETVSTCGHSAPPPSAYTSCGAAHGKAHCALVVEEGALDGSVERIVGLVDKDHVGGLGDASFQALAVRPVSRAGSAYLQLVASARRDQQHENIDEIGHVELRLADPDGLDDDRGKAGVCGW